MTKRSIFLFISFLAGQTFMASLAFANDKEANSRIAAFVAAFTPAQLAVEVKLNSAEDKICKQNQGRPDKAEISDFELIETELAEMQDSLVQMSDKLTPERRRIKQSPSKKSWSGNQILKLADELDGILTESRNLQIQLSNLKGDFIKLEDLTDAERERMGISYASFESALAAFYDRYEKFFNNCISQTFALKKVARNSTSATANTATVKFTSEDVRSFEAKRNAKDKKEWEQEWDKTKGKPAGSSNAPARTKGIRARI